MKTKKYFDDLYELDETFPPLYVVATPPLEKSGIIDLAALKLGDGGSAEEYLCRSGGDLGADNRMTHKNPRYEAYHNGNMLSSKVWEKETGRWALGARHAIAIRNYTFCWIVTRVSFEEFLEFPIKLAVRTPTEEFMKNAERRLIGKVSKVRHHMPLPSSYRPSSSSSMYSSFSSPSSHSSSSGGGLVMEIVPPFIEWSQSARCPWKYYRMVLPFNGHGDVNKIKFRQQVEAQYKDQDHRDRVLSKMVGLHSLMIAKWDSEIVRIDFKGTLLKDENDVCCVYVKEMQNNLKDNGPIMNVKLDQFLALIECRDAMREEAAKFVQLIRKPGTELDIKRWTYYKTIPPTNDKGVVDFEKVKSMCLRRDVDVSLRDLLHHCYEGGARPLRDEFNTDEYVELIAKGIASWPPPRFNFRWVWHLKARLEKVEGGMKELRVESVRNDDFVKTPPFRHVDMQEFARLLHFKNRGTFKGNTPTTYTYFKLLETPTWGENFYADPPACDEPYGSSACEILTEMATFVDNEDTGTHSSSRSSRGSTEGKRRG